MGADVQELELTMGRALSISWLIIWRGIAGGLLIGAVIGAILGAILALAGMDVGQISLVTAPVGVVVGLVWWVFCIRMAMKKKYRDFRIALVPREPQAG